MQLVFLEKSRQDKRVFNGFIKFKFLKNSIRSVGWSKVIAVYLLNTYHREDSQQVLG